MKLQILVLYFGMVESRGSKNMINIATKKGLKLFLVMI